MKTRTTSKHSLRGGVLSLLLVLPIALSGCGKSTKALKVGTLYPENSHPMAITADTDTFPIDNVVVNLHFALYSTDSCQTPGVNPLADFYRSENNRGILVALYFSDTTASFPRADDDFDYVSIPNYQYIKEYPHEVVTSEAFGYTVNKKFFSKTISYEHSEQLSIPAEMFPSDRNEFDISLFEFDTSIIRKKLVVSPIRRSIVRIRYKLQEDGTVKLISD